MGYVGNYKPFKPFRFWFQKNRDKRYFAREYAKLKLRSELDNEKDLNFLSNEYDALVQSLGDFYLPPRPDEKINQHSNMRAITIDIPRILQALKENPELAKKLLKR